jgi:hypothetical protein
MRPSSLHSKQPAERLYLARLIAESIVLCLPIKICCQHAFELIGAELGATGL